MSATPPSPLIRMTRWTVPMIVAFFNATAAAQTYTYDNLNRLVQVSYAGGKGITYTYDTAGNMTTRYVNATGATTGRWKSRYAMLGSNSDWVPPETTIANGIIKLPPSGSPTSYFWSQHVLDLGRDIAGDDFSLEVRLKNLAAEGGITAYDVNLGMQSNTEYAQPWYGTWVSFMGESWASGYTSMGANNVSSGPLSPLVQDLSNWHSLKLSRSGKTIQIHYDNALIQTFSPEVIAGVVRFISITTKGSGSIDAVKLTAKGKLIVDDTFDARTVTIHPD